MTAVKTFSRRTLVTVMVSMAVVLLLFSAAHYVLLETIADRLDLLSRADELLAEQRLLVEQMEAIRAAAGIYYVPAAALVLAAVGLLLWKITCRLFAALSADPGRRAERPVERRPLPAVEEKPRRGGDEQLFLHLLGVFQREGRLMDFFAEDLSRYEDGQIGAAVRTIHENCRRAALKYIEPAPVLDLPEGRPCTVEPDFDPSAIKLTGNVSGAPPFEGVVRHRGWRAGRIDLPTLTAGRDVRLIAPAEVEIL